MSTFYCVRDATAYMENLEILESKKLQMVNACKLKLF